MSKTRWLSDTEQSIWRSFALMTAQLRGQLYRDLIGTGLSGQDYEVLAQLSDQADERSRITEIAHDLGWEKSRLSHHLTRMEQRGLVVRERCPNDQRGWNIRMTDAGRDAIAAAAPRHVESVRRYVVDALSPRQLSALQSITRTIMAQLPPAE